jgi:hypothetical protein
MAFLNLISWLGAPLLIALIFGVVNPKFRALAFATLLVAVPLSVLLALNNNHANAVRNFFMGMVMFATPLLFHALVVSVVKQRQASL